MSEALNFEMKAIKEGSAEVFIPVETKISKKLPVFYNPVMKQNRDLSVLLLKQFPKMNICDPLAGSGIRSIRFALELDYQSIVANDINENAVSLIEKNMNHNNVKFEIQNKDANKLILDSEGFDYIDLDVFGSPNFMLDSSITRISRKGILAVTATDTAPLCGTYPATCKRKYWSTPIRNEHMHEIGIRILIRKVQLIGAQYEKALTPIFSYSKDHYFRTFFHAEKSKTKADEILKNHQYFHYCHKCINHFTSKNNKETCCEKLMETAGPIYVDKINEEKLLKRMIENNEEKENNEFLQMISSESRIANVGFYNLHVYSRKYKTGIPRTDDLLNKLRKSGFFAEKTMFDIYGIKTDAKLKEFKELL